MPLTERYNSSSKFRLVVLKVSNYWWIHAWWMSLSSWLIAIESSSLSHRRRAFGYASVASRTWTDPVWIPKIDRRTASGWSVAADRERRLFSTTMVQPICMWTNLTFRIWVSSTMIVETARWISGRISTRSCGVHQAPFRLELCSLKEPENAAQAYKSHHWIFGIVFTKWTMCGLPFSITSMSGDPQGLAVELPVESTEWIHRVQIVGW